MESIKYSKDGYHLETSSNNKENLELAQTLLGFAQNIIENYEEDKLVFKVDLDAFSTIDSTLDNYIEDEE